MIIKIEDVRNGYMRNGYRNNDINTSQVGGVRGCVVSDRQGLCLAVKGKFSAESSGVITSISQQAKMLEPDNPRVPVIILEGDTRQCFIQEHGDIIAAIHKTVIP